MTRVDSTVAFAIGRRDFRRYFNNPTGYLFVTLFIFLSAGAAFWRPRFFLNNLATLDQLNEVFPYLLLFFIPALAMTAWSDERKQGTDELLLILPAQERELVAGKFIATLGVYSVALTLSLSQVVVLLWLGRPDLTLLASNYLGYWLLGAVLIPIATLASLGTANATVAFIIGSLYCAAIVLPGPLVGALSSALAPRVAPLSAVTHFDDFARGIVSLDGLLYFVLLGAGALYLNVVLLERRRWPDEGVRWPGSLLRGISVFVIGTCAIVLAGRAHVRLDLTSGRIHSLSPETRRLLSALPRDRPVTVHAFISRDVPETFVQTREDLLSVLREIDAIAGGRVTTTIFDTEPYSESARFARERYDIEPRAITDARTGDTASDVYLGVALTAGAEEQVLGFFDRGRSAEYQIARAIRVVTRAQRKRVGIIDGDVKIFGGVDFHTGETHPAWAIVDELREQYEVVAITPVSAITEPVDALVVVLPSRLSQSEIDLVQEPIKRGTPTLILIDPLPLIDLRLAPASQLAEELDPYRKNPVSVRRNYGDVRRMLLDLGINWVPARIGFDGYNPHPDLAQLPAEAVFVGRGSGNPAAFNTHDPATAGLEEVLLLYPGALAPGEQDRFVFEPLLTSGPLSGTASFFDVVRPSPTGLALNESFTRQSSTAPNVLAARSRSKPGAAPGPAFRPVNVTAIADLDFIADNFFDIRASAQASANFDNITLFLNAIDELAGDDLFIALRNHRTHRRTLERVEAQTRRFLERRRADERHAETDARAALAEARSRVKSRVDAINQRRDLDTQAKQIMTRTLEEIENRRLRVLDANIESEKNQRILAGRETMEAQVRRIRGTIRVVAVLLPPIPVLLFGAWIFVTRRRREDAGTRALGRLRTQQ